MINPQTAKFFYLYVVMYICFRVDVYNSYQDCYSSEAASINGAKQEGTTHIRAKRSPGFDYLGLSENYTFIDQAVSLFTITI